MDSLKDVGQCLLITLSTNLFGLYFHEQISKVVSSKDFGNIYQLLLSKNLFGLCFIEHISKNNICVYSTNVSSHLKLLILNIQNMTKETKLKYTKRKPHIYILLLVTNHGTLKLVYK